MVKRKARHERKGRNEMADKFIHNGIWAPTERSSRMRVFMALGFDFDDAFDLAGGYLVVFK